ncbi:MAG: AraC family transcriptional regulator, partial [Bacteroidota bacterium]
LVVHFSDLLIPEVMRSFILYQSILAALQNARYGLVLLEPNKSMAQDLLANFKSAPNLQQYLDLLKVLHLFGDDRATTKLCSEGYAHPTLKGASRRLEKVLQYIQKNYTRKLPIEEVARQIHLSPSAFSHYFKKRTLKSFTHFVLELRLGKAAQLLQFTDKSITTVSHECGFHNLSHFNRSFQNKYGLAPLRFRQARG